MYRLYGEESQNSTVRRKASRETKRFSHSVGGVGKNRSFAHGWGGVGWGKNPEIRQYFGSQGCGKLWSTKGGLTNDVFQLNDVEFSHF